MAIKRLSSEEVIIGKYNAAISECEAIERVLVEQHKESISDLITIDHLYDLKNHIDQLLIDWQETEIESEDDEDE